MKLWICKCGHEVTAEERPPPIKWTDGHVCYFYEASEEETLDAELEDLADSLGATLIKH